jgi:hypothetical protein
MNFIQFLQDWVHGIEILTKLGKCLRQQNENWITRKNSVSQK